MKYLFFASLSFILLISSGCDLFENENETPEIPGRLVFSAPDNSEKENYQIFTSNTDGSGLKQLTHFDNDEAFNPAWSPDGEQIAFVTTLRSSSAGGSLYVMNADGANIRPLKEREGSTIVVPGSNPSWSPDGTKIAFDWCQNCELGGNNFEIYMYDFETDSVEQITDSPAIDDFPTWDSNGNIIAFSSGREYANRDTLRFRKDLYKINVNTKEHTRLTTTGNATKPVWSPLENLIFYEWNIKGNKIFKFNMNSKSIEQIDSGLEFSGSTQFSKGGSRIIVYGRETESSSPEIRFFKFVQDSIIFVTKELSNNFLSKGRDFDWHYDENEL